MTAAMMKLLHHPEHGMRVIHIAGTNGKGSVAAFVSSILQAASFCVGQFTSPHLVDFRERIQVNGEQISREDAVRLGERLFALPMQSEGTMFDYCLAMACLYFQERQCDFVVLETGLGGRLDSTSGLDVTPLVCAFTNIGYDHTQYLGETLEEIAAEKAGILKPGCHAVLGRMERCAREVIVQSCRELHVDWKAVDEDGDGGVTAALPDGRSTVLGLPGAYQRENAATAAIVFETLCDIQPGLQEKNHAWNMQVLRRGLAKARWPGRMEVLSEEPFFLVDGAHNPEGAAALAKSLRELRPGERFVFLVGVMADKAYGKMLDALLPLTDCCYTATVDSGRSLPGEILAEEIRSRGVEAVCCKTPEEALERALGQGGGQGQPVVAFGSLYFIGSIKEKYK